MEQDVHKKKGKKGSDIKKKKKSLPGHEEESE